MHFYATQQWRHLVRALATQMVTTMMTRVVVQLPLMNAIIADVEMAIEVGSAHPTERAGDMKVSEMATPTTAITIIADVLARVLATTMTMILLAVVIITEEGRQTTFAVVDEIIGPICIL